MNKFFVCSIISIFALLTCGFQCNKNSFNPNYIRLKATLNNINETISLGDTLQFILLIPDILTVINEDDGSTQNVTISTLQEASYVVDLEEIDTITNTSKRIWDNNVLFASIGKVDAQGGIYASTNSKPYMSVLNVLPKSKGIYMLAVSTSSLGLIANNNNYLGGLRVDFSIPNIHSSILPTGLYTGGQLTNRKDAGYGIYFFRVN